MHLRPPYSSIRVVPSFGVVLATFCALCVVRWLAFGPFPHDSQLRTPEQNRAHALRFLPHATMLQAASAGCPEGHFGADERYGYSAQDFQLILAAPRPDSVFAELVDRPELMARLYGLIGLQLTAPADFAAAARRVSVPDTLIAVATSCDEPEERPARAVLAEITRGEWGALDAALRAPA